MSTTTSLRMSPLARKLCGKLGVKPERLHGSGPRGKIMAADVLAPDESTAPGGSKLADPRLFPSGSDEGNYLVFEFEADMARLAAMSTPIAVQCEKLLQGRYSLFDYIVRAVVKARTAYPSSQETAPLDLLLIGHSGQLQIGIGDSARKTIYTLACEARQEPSFPADGVPDIAVCDAGTPEEDIRRQLANGAGVVLSVGGTTPKIGIECGRPVSRLILPLKLYVNSVQTAPDTAERLAMELQTLLENPVVLLLL